MTNDYYLAQIAKALERIADVLEAPGKTAEDRLNFEATAYAAEVLRRRRSDRR